MMSNSFITVNNVTFYKYMTLDVTKDGPLLSRIQLIYFPVICNSLYFVYKNDKKNMNKIEEKVIEILKCMSSHFLQ